MTVSGDPDGEARVAAVLLGGSALAVMLGLRSICRLLRRRETLTGRKLTEAEVDKLLEVADLVPVLREEIATVKRTLPELERKIDEVLARGKRFRITDRLPNG